MESDETKNPEIAGASLRLQAAVRMLMRPLVHLLLSRQLTFPILTRLLKDLYVEVASEEFAIKGKRLTDSRINLLTGIHRKDVRRLRQDRQDREEPAPDSRPKSISLGAQIVARWTDQPEFQDEHGRPGALPRRPTPGESSFDDLVSSVSRDIRPRSVLDEWQRLGVVHLDDRDRVVLNSDAFIPSRSFDEKAHSLGHTLHDHMDNEPPLIERSVFYSGLSDASVAELLALSEERGMQALHAVNRRAMELQERDRDRKGALHRRMRLGIYTFRARRGDKNYAD
ncbi:MAG: hypothetical protein JRG94_20935 [Deltaproteobacteria bacterium]|nr:hypothetical protein [Deltaproteobacteria bacterium]